MRLQRKLGAVIGALGLLATLSSRSVEAQPGQTIDFGATIAASTPALVVPLPQDLKAGEHRSTAMVVDRRGHIVAHQEAVVVVDEAGSRPAIELFAADHSLRARLQARRDAPDLNVVLRVDGRDLGRWSLIEAFDQAAFLLGEGGLPSDLREIAIHDFTANRAKPRTVAAADAATPVCQNSCQAAWMNCLHTCERFPRPGCEETCDTRLNTCLGSCGCPEVTTYTTSGPVFTATGAQRCMSYSQVSQTCSAQAPGRLYNLFSRRVRTDTHQKTVSCDGSVTDVITATSYSSATTCGFQQANSPTCSAGSNPCAYPLCQ